MKKKHQPPISMSPLSEVESNHMPAFAGSPGAAAAFATKGLALAFANIRHSSNRRLVQGAL